MKKILLGLLLLVLFFFLFPKSTWAEAGLSEAARTEYFRINDRFGFEILPGGEGGKGPDSINIFEYRKSSQKLNFCAAKYEFVPGGAKGNGVSLYLSSPTYLSG